MSAVQLNLCYSEKDGVLLANPIETWGQADTACPHVGKDDMNVRGSHPWGNNELWSPIG